MVRIILEYTWTALSHTNSLVALRAYTFLLAPCRRRLFLIVSRFLHFLIDLRFIHNIVTDRSTVLVLSERLWSLPLSRLYQMLYRTPSRRQICWIHDSWNMILLIRIWQLTYFFHPIRYKCIPFVSIYPGQSCCRIWLKRNIYLFFV